MTDQDKTIAESQTETDPVSQFSQFSPFKLSRRTTIIVVVFVLLSILVAFLVGGLVLGSKGKNNPPAGGQRVCTQEAKQCPDGSYVSRTGPNCEFPPCPKP